MRTRPSGAPRRSTSIDVEYGGRMHGRDLSHRHRRRVPPVVCQTGTDGADVPGTPALPSHVSHEQSRAEQWRAEQWRAMESNGEQRRAEKSREEQSRAGQWRDASSRQSPRTTTTTTTTRDPSAYLRLRLHRSPPPFRGSFRKFSTIDHQDVKAVYERRGRAHRADVAAYDQGRGRPEIVIVPGIAGPCGSDGGRRNRHWYSMVSWTSSRQAARRWRREWEEKWSGREAFETCPAAQGS